MKESRREFFKKSGKNILKGAGWTALSLLGLNTSGCLNSGYCTNYTGSCDYNYNYCNYCTGGSCTSCTYCTYDTGSNTIVTDLTLTLDSNNFSKDDTYTFIITSNISQVIINTQEFGQWNGNKFTGKLNIEHEIYEDVTVELRKTIFSDPFYAESQIKAFNINKGFYEIIFNWFPVGVYFCVKSNQNTTPPIGSVNVTIKDNGNNIITTNTGDPKGIVKFYVRDITDQTRPIEANIPYTAYFNKQGFTDISESFTIQTDLAGIPKSLVRVIYMVPV